MKEGLSSLIPDKTLNPGSKKYNHYFLCPDKCKSWIAKKNIFNSDTPRFIVYLSTDLTINACKKVNLLLATLKISKSLILATCTCKLFLF